MGAQPFCSILPDSGHPLADRAFSHAQRLGNSLLLPAPLFEGQRLPPSRFLPVGGSWKSFCHASSYHGQKSLEIYATVSNRAAWPGYPHQGEVAIMLYVDFAEAQPRKWI